MCKETTEVKEYRRERLGGSLVVLKRPDQPPAISSPAELDADVGPGAPVLDG